MYPSLLVFNRECTKDYTFDDGVRIEKGMLVYIPVYGMQTDPYYFPEPKKFDPDRFSKENRDLIKPYSYLPFGAGSRVCIGKFNSSHFYFSFSTCIKLIFFRRTIWYHAS